MVDYKNSWKIWGEEFKRIGAASRHTRRKILEYSKEVEFDSVIDIGCATGILLENFDDKKVAGIDISPEGIKVCKKKFPGSVFKVADISDFRSKKKYDLAISSEVLEHVECDYIAMMNIATFAKYLIITVPSGKFGPDDVVQGHFRRYSVQMMKDRLNVAGFEILKIERWGFPFYSPFYRFIMNRTKEGDMRGEMNTFKRVVSNLMYKLFFFNIPNMGDRIFVLARNKNIKEDYRDLEYRENRRFFPW